MDPNAIVTAILGSVGVVLSLCVYRLTQQQREDAWLQHFAQIHHAFWNDPDLADVRAWLACDDAYGEIEPILQKRRDRDKVASISRDEYRQIEKLDKFFNILHRVVRLNPKLARENQELRIPFLDYWLEKSLTSEEGRRSRSDLNWYVTEFYGNLWVYHNQKSADANAGGGARPAADKRDQPGAERGVHLAAAGFRPI